jgi:hypothetical protein
MVTNMLAALDIEMVKKIAIGLAVVFVLVALLVAKVVKSVTTKAITILILGALVVGVISQRQSLTSCKDQVVAGNKSTCSFFGYKVKLPGVPNIPG